MQVLNDLFDRVDSVVDVVTSGAEQYRLWVPGAVIALEELGIPLPLPGDVIVMYLGYRIAAGSMTLQQAAPQMLVGILIGATGLFVISRRWGRPLLERHGKLWHLTESRRRRVERFTTRFGAWGVAVGRHAGLRCPMTLFSAAFGMRLGRFWIAVTLSSIVWIAIWLTVGATLGDAAARSVRHYSYSGVILGLVAYSALFLGPPLVHLLRRDRHVDTT